MYNNKLISIIKKNNQKKNNQKKINNLRIK